MMKADWSQRAQNRTICTQVCASLTQCVGRPYSAIRPHGRAAGGLGDSAQMGPAGILRPRFCARLLKPDRK